MAVHSLSVNRSEINHVRRPPSHAYALDAGNYGLHLPSIVCLFVYQVLCIQMM
jgi:hypothetical protein